MSIQNLVQQFASVSPGGAAALNGSVSGALDQAQDLMKALTASNYQTDVATLTGGGALGIQSLDHAMKATVQEQQHFVLFKQLASTSATNIVDEYVRKTGIGGHLGGSTNLQMGTVRGSTGEYNREVGLVKFLMTMRQVGYVGSLVSNIASLESEEELNGALQLLTDAEYLLMHGNSEVCPTEYDGIFAILDKEYTDGAMSGDHIIDMQGNPLNSIEPFTQIGASVAQYGNWGMSTDAYMTQGVQNDLNMDLDPAYRWSSQPSNTPLTLGAHVEGIRLQNGVLKTHMDTFLTYDDFPMAKPFEVTWSAQATANNGFKPQSVTLDASASATDSQFTAARAGNYYYAVAGIGANGEGQSTVLVSTQTAVAAGKKAVISIAASTANSESGYAIYRGRLNGTNAVGDLRLMTVVKKHASGTTTYTDINRDIPGTTKVPVLNMASASDAIGWRQFQPMTKIPLPFGVGGVPVYSWFQFLFGYLRVTKPKHHGYIKNVVPSNAAWKPFN